MTIISSIQRSAGLKQRPEESFWLVLGTLQPEAFGVIARHSRSNSFARGSWYRYNATGHRGSSAMNLICYR